MSPTPEARRRRKALGAVTAACVVFLIIGGIWVGAKLLALASDTNQLAENTREAQETNAEVLQLIKDCTLPTDPPSECARRSQEQTAKAVALISQETQYRIVVALGCETDVDSSIEEIEACVKKETARLERERRP